jgi:hypothetical protein
MTYPLFLPYLGDGVGEILRQPYLPPIFRAGGSGGVAGCQPSGGLPPEMALGCGLTSVRGDRGEDYKK